MVRIANFKPVISYSFVINAACIHNLNKSRLVDEITVHMFPEVRIHVLDYSALNCAKIRNDSLHKYPADNESNLTYDEIPLLML